MRPGQSDISDVTHVFIIQKRMLCLISSFLLQPKRSMQEMQEPLLEMNSHILEAINFLQKLKLQRVEIKHWKSEQ